MLKQSSPSGKPKGENAIALRIRERAEGLADHKSMRYPLKNEIQIHIVI